MESYKFLKEAETSKVNKIRLQSAFVVDEEKTPELYADTLAGDYKLPQGILVVLKGADQTEIAIGDGNLTWEDAVKFASGNGVPIPIGTDRQVIDGLHQPVTLGWKHLSDQPLPPEFKNGVLTMAAIPGSGENEFGFMELGVDDDFAPIAKPNTIPIYRQGLNGGQLLVADAMFGDHAVTLRQVNATFDTKLTASKGVAVANATDEADAVVKLNALLVSLRTAGIITT